MHKSQPPKKRIIIPGVDYTPAQLQKGSNNEWRIVFYVMKPGTQELTRIRKRVKPVANKSTRQQFANRIIAEINLKLAKGWNPLVENENVSAFNLLRDCMEEFITKVTKQYQDESVRYDTLRAYTSYIENIKKFMADKLLLDAFVINFNNKFVSDFLDYIYYERKNSPTTHNNYLQFMVNIGNYFKDKGYISANPAEGMRRIKEKEKVRTIIPKTVRAEIKEYLSHNKPTYLCLCMMTYYCYIRRTEITKLKVADIQLKKGIIAVKTTTAKKGKAESGVTIPQALMELLAVHLKHTTNDMYLFSYDNFKPGHKQLTPKKISDEWDRLRIALSLPMKYQFYSLKDTGITELLDIGIPSYKVQKQARHSDLKMTEKYISNKHYDMDRDIFKYDNF